MTDKATIYTDRREFLVASVGDTRRAFAAGEGGIYGLATTEHEFRKALCLHRFPGVNRLNKAELQEMMAEELKATTESESTIDLRVPKGKR